MKKLMILLLLVLFAGITVHAQDLYHRVRVDLKDKDVHELAKIGVEVDHGHIAIGRYIENDFSAIEIKQINEAGFSTEILIEDVTTYYREQMAAGLQRFNGVCTDDDPFQNIETPTNFELGSMGGYYLYEEMLDILDDMQAKFPHLITVKAQIGDIVTHEGREIYAVEISDNPGVNEGEPASLYTSIHHAREPGGMTALIYFMWYLLENYESDVLVKEILDNTSLHFVPCVNPDGYIYNQTIQPEGGGLWRKNRRDNGDESFGVDLNRNYGFEWGIDDNGSSSNPVSNTYRGPEAFSEPETQAMKLYCESHNFTMALNYHTFGNLLIHPWGYNDTPTPEDIFFKGVATEMTKLNTYTYGTASETVGYQVNGISDDWMYGEEGTKNKIYTMTPEVGIEGFWPPIDRIVYNCQANIRANLINASILLNYPYVNSSEIALTDEFEGKITVEFGQLGFQAAPFDIKYSVLSGNASLAKTSEQYAVEQLETVAEEINFSIDNSIGFGEEVIIAVEVEGMESLLSDTLVLQYYFGSTNTSYKKDAIGDGEIWVADGEQWFYDPNEFVSPDFSLTESPSSTYESDTEKSIKSKPMTLPASNNLSLTFDLLVDIEEGYDYAVLYIEEVGQQMIPLCGNFSSEPKNGQPEGVPVYDGDFGWVKEQIDITAWAESEVIFTLTFSSDGFFEGEGINIDDFEIFSLDQLINTNETAIGDFNVYPNPAYDYIKLGLPYDKIKQSKVYDPLGQLMFTSGTKQDQIDITGLSSGNYFVVVEGNDGQFYKANFVVLN